MKFKSIVITGASSGIGAALAKHLSGKGVSLYLTGRDKARLEEVVRACQDKGAKASGYVIDVTNEAGMRERLLDLDQKTPIDLVIANAGISAGTGSDIAESEEQIRRIFDVNVNGVLNTIQPLIPAMIARGRGQIAIMSSLAGYRGFPGAPAYCGSKAAVKVYGEALRGSLRQSGIGVSVICPGFVKSRMTEANDFKMPLLMEGEKAASTIVRGLEKNKGRIAFPAPTAFFSWFFMVLPDTISAYILGFFPAKGSSEKV